MTPPTITPGQVYVPKPLPGSGAMSREVLRVDGRNVQYRWGVRHEPRVCSVARFWAWCAEAKAVRRP